MRIFITAPSTLITFAILPAVINEYDLNGSRCIPGEQG